MKKIVLFLLFPVLGFGQYVFNTKAELQTAVDLYIADNNNAINTYGDINTWDVSNITDMSSLFSGKITFNENISNWDTSNVLDMQYMFYNAEVFNQDISNWCVTNISSEPINFSNNSSLIEENKPVWGTCPALGLDNQNQLNISIYPNPTSSLLALNSDKEYQIKVYDLLGNKVLETQGNSVNMEQLSTATYIVKATDKSNNEELTYKVVKN